MGSSTFKAKMNVFKQKMAKTYGENGLETPFLSDSTYLGHFQTVIPLIQGLLRDLAHLKVKWTFFKIKWLRLKVKMDWKRHFYQIPPIYGISRWSFH